MAISMPPQGLIIDLITPLDKKGNIDGRSLGRHLDRVLPHVQGVCLAGPITGEGIKLKTSQRDELLDKALVVIRGKVPVMIWISGNTSEETRSILSTLEKRVAKRKYAGPVFWVDTPLYYHSNRGLFSHYENLISSHTHPILLHNDPGLIKKMGRPFKRNNIRTSILKDLVRIDKITGMIYSGPIDRARNYRSAARNRFDFKIYEADEKTFLNFPSTTGLVSKGANLSPLSWTKMVKSSIDPGRNEDIYPDDLEQIFNIGDKLTQMTGLYKNNPITLIKATLTEMGIFESKTTLVEKNNTTLPQEKIKQLTALIEL